MANNGVNEEDKRWCMLFAEEKEKKGGGGVNIKNGNKFVDFYVQHYENGLLRLSCYYYS